MRKLLWNCGVWVMMGFQLAAPSRGGVMTSDESGFALRSEVRVGVTPAVAYQRFVDIGSWWSPSHTFSGDANNLSLTPVPGGQFLEKLPDGGFVRHMDVVYAAPGKMLRLNGALGPLGEHAVQGVMTATFTETPEGTTIEVRYHVGGYVPGGLRDWAPPVDAVITDQLKRLHQTIDSPPKP